MKKIISSTAVLWALPLLAFAQVGSNPFLTILVRTKQLLDAAVPIVITLALIYFIYGVTSYVTAKDDEKKAEARNVMIYGTIGLFFIVSVWGIVTLLQQFTGVQPLTAPPSLPRIPG
ncbi:MAG: pilin [bacterium]|nr:pilin [bacterium]